jgi:L,D-transpeptidase YbiS
MIDPAIPALDPPSPLPGEPVRLLLTRARTTARAGLLLLGAISGIAVPTVLLYGLTPARVPRRLAAAVVDADEAATRQAALDRSFSALRPRGIFVTVDTYANRLRVHREEDLLREATCSTGSGLALRDPRDGRLWVFSTPLGERTVQRKVVDPVWVKPDWAFVEEGVVPPRLDSRERVDTFSLGEFALYLGDGYLIHGTLFQTLLGRRVTHGCIRLGDEDLSYVYRQVPVGARVVLY